MVTEGRCSNGIQVVGGPMEQNCGQVVGMVQEWYPPPGLVPS